MKTVAVLISIDDFSNGREVAKSIQGKTFRNEDDLLRTVRDKLKDFRDEDERNEENGGNDGYVEIVSLHELVDQINENDGQVGQWIATVNINSYASADSII